MRFLVTAGNTREMIDSVRAWSNIFTGNTGYAIAHELSTFGHVDLLTGNEQHISQVAGNNSIHGIAFKSHADLKKQLEACMKERQYDAIFMTAAVADYQPIGGFSVMSRQNNSDGTESWTVKPAQAGKIKSTHKALAILGEPTEKLIDLFRGVWNYQGLLVKFKLEVGIGEKELKRIAEASRVGSGADFIVANTLEMVQGDSAGAWLLGAQSAEWIERENLPRRLVELAVKGRG